MVCCGTLMLMFLEYVKCEICDKILIKTIMLALFLFILLWELYSIT